MDNSTKKCLFCWSEISEKAVWCKHCGGMFINDFWKNYCPFCLLEVPVDMYICPYCDELLPKAFEYSWVATPRCCPHIPDSFDDIIGNFSFNLHSHSIDSMIWSIRKLKIWETISPCWYIYELKCVWVVKSWVLLENINNDTLFFVRSDVDIFFIKWKKYIIPDAIQPLKIDNIINSYDSLCENSDYTDYLDNVDFVEELYSNTEFFDAGWTKEFLKKLSKHPELIKDGEICPDCNNWVLKIINYDAGIFEICTGCWNCRHIRFPDPIYE